MMEIHIQLAGVELGPFSEPQIQEYLTEGLLSAKDLARLEGTDIWEPVGELLAKLPREEITPQPPVTMPEPAPEIPLATVPPPVVPTPVPTMPAIADVPAPPPEPSPVPVALQTLVPNPAEAPRQALPLRVKSLGKKTTPGSRVSPSQALSLPASQPDKSLETSGRLLAASIRAIPKIKAQEAKAASLPENVPAGPVRVVAKKPEPEVSPEVKPASAGIQADLPSTVRALVKKVEPGARTVPAAVPALPAPPKREAATPPTLKVISKKPAPRPQGPGGIQLAPLRPPTVPAPSPAASVTVTPEQSIPVSRLPAAPTPLPQVSPPEPIPAWLKFLAAAMVFFGLAYIGLPYYSAGSLWNALGSGRQDQLQSTIDFPALRQSMKDQFEAQIPKPDSHGVTPSADVLTMIKNSIDLYVTPEGIAKLTKKSFDFPRTDQTPTISPDVAANLLMTFNDQTVRSRRLVSVDDFVLELDSARLHLRFYGPDWELNHIELKSGLALPSLPAAAASTNTVTSPAPALSTPVVETYINQGKASYQKGEWDAAIAAFNQVLAIDPKMTAAYNNRAFARQAKGDFDGAIADFSQALSLDPQLGEVYFSRGNVKMTKGDLEGALADFTQAINIDPKMEGAYYSRGNARAAKGDYDDAITDYTEVVTLNPNQANAFSNRGFARRAKNDLDGAIDDYTQALAIDPKIAEAYYNRGLVRQAKGNADGAILDFSQALDLDPKMAGAYFNRGNAKNTKHDLDGAIGDYNQALTLDPKISMAWCNRGLAKQGKDDLDGALADYTQALSLDPKLSVAWYNRGLIKEQTDDLDGAIADSSQALTLDPNQAQATYNRGFAKLAKGDLSGAAADFRKFCELDPRDHYSDHARLYLWLIRNAQGGKVDADQALSDSLLTDWNSTSDDLVSKIANFLLDRMSEADLTAAAASSDVTKDQGQHCEVWYFAGMKRLLSGDKTTATDYFHRCMATQKKDYCEYILSKAELQSLETPFGPAKT